MTKLTYTVLDKKTGEPIDSPDADGNDLFLKPNGDLVWSDWKGRLSAPANSEYELRLEFTSDSGKTTISVPNGEVKTETF